MSLHGQWCSDEQYLRLHCRRDDDPCLPSVFLKMVVVVDACNKPSTPRTPSLLLPTSSLERDSQPGQVPLQAHSQPYGTQAPSASALEVPGISSADPSAVDVMVDDFLVDCTPTTSTELDDSFCQADRGTEVDSGRQAAGQQQQELAAECPSLQELVAELCQPDNQPPSSDNSPQPVQALLEHLEVPAWGSPTMPRQDTSDGEGADLSALPAQRPADGAAGLVPPPASQPAKLVPLPPIIMSAAPAGNAANQGQQSMAGIQGGGQDQWELIDPSTMAAYGIIDLLQVGSEQQVSAAQLQSCP